MPKGAFVGYLPRAGRRGKSPRPKTWTAWRPRSQRGVYTWHSKKRVWGMYPHDSWCTCLGPRESEAERQITVTSNPEWSEPDTILPWAIFWEPSLRCSGPRTSARLYLDSADQRQLNNGVYNFQSMSLFIPRNPIPHATQGTSEFRSLDFASLGRAS